MKLVQDIERFDYYDLFEHHLPDQILHPSIHVAFCITQANHLYPLYLRRSRLRPLKSLTCLPLPVSLLPPWQCMTNNLRSSIVHSLFRLSTHHPTFCRNASRIANDSATKAAMASSVAAALLSGRVDCGVQCRERSPPYTLGIILPPPIIACTETRPPCA
jgi:hypothetical protein